MQEPDSQAIYLPEKPMSLIYFTCTILFLNEDAWKLQ